MFVFLAGANQLMMGVDMVVVCVFEFFAYFIVDYFIRLVGHSCIMYIGLLGYAIRFVVYASIRNPWTVLPVETLQGSYNHTLPCADWAHFTVPRFICVYVYVFGVTFYTAYVLYYDTVGWT